MNKRIAVAESERSLRGAVGLVAALIGVIAAASVQAAELRVAAPSAGCVPQLGENFYCDLREAFEVSNRTPEADTLKLDKAATYTLTAKDHEDEGGNGLPAINGVLSIEGNGATIARGDAADVPSFRLIRVDRSGDLTLNRVTLRNGATQRGFDGAAIWSSGKLTLELCVLEENHSGDDGGAIRSDGFLKISDSFVRANSARWRGGVGGGLQTSTQFGSADTLIERTTFEDNEAWASGGALWLMGTTVLVNTTVSGNRAGERGGGLQNYGIVRLRNVTITNNQAVVGGGGLFTYGPASLSNTVLAGNRAMIARDCEGELTSYGYNQVGTSYRCTLSGEQTGNVQGTIGQALDPLTEADALRAHTPSIGSVLIDAGNPAQPGSSDWTCDKVDQRRVNRIAGACDIGAVERGQDH